MSYTFELQTGQAYYERCRYFQRILMEGALKFLEGVKRNQKISLSNGILKLFGVDRYAKARSLKELENANLIVVARKQGRSPVVTILSVE